MQKDIETINMAISKGRYNPMLPQYVKDALEVLPNVLYDFERRIQSLEQGGDNAKKT